MEVAARRPSNAHAMGESPAPAVSDASLRIPARRPRLVRETSVEPPEDGVEARRSACRRGDRPRSELHAEPVQDRQLGLHDSRGQHVVGQLEKPTPQMLREARKP